MIVEKLVIVDIYPNLQKLFFEQLEKRSKKYRNSRQTFSKASKLSKQTLSSNQVEPTPTIDENSDSTTAVKAGDSMQEYYQLKQNLLLATFAITAIIFVSVWIVYSLNTSLSYLLGACVGVVYLSMLAREVERIGAHKKSVGSTRLALLAGVIIVATQLQQLQIVPIFLGFLTYKAAIILYVLQTTLMPADK